MNALAAEALSIARSHQMRHQAIQDAARTDPTLHALYRIWLIATDTSETAPVSELNDALTRIDHIAKQALDLT